VRKDSADARKSIQSDKALIMSYVPTESIALHIIRPLVRGLGKTQGQGVSIQNLRHWWTMSLGQQSENFELGLEYAGNCHWIERGPDNIILLTSQGSAKVGTFR
jgi:hypothetical protein